MDNYQKVEQLVNKTNCSYEDAKAALESSGWDMLDAVISLERDGKVNKETAEQTVQMAAEAVDITPEVEADKTAESVSQQIIFSCEDGEAGKKGSGDSKKAKSSAKREHRLWNRIKSILMNNRMVILRSSGQQIIDLPILVPVIALIAFFWATLGLAVVAMIFGCRFHFEGEDLGKTNINDTMDKATDYAEKVKNDLKRKSNDE